MTPLKIEDFNIEEQDELETFAKKHMQDSCSSTNGDSFKMGISLEGIKIANEQAYFDNYDFINEKIEIVQKKLSSLLK